MTKLLLTRFLYIFDEVCISFLTSLLKKQSLDECYFWISELYLSGLHNQCWEFMWFTYYDFYYMNNPFFEEYLIKKYAINDFKSILSVIKNMFKLKSSPHIFMTRQYNKNVKEITHIFRGKKPNWLIKYPSKYHALLRFIDKKLYHFAVSCLPDIIDDEFINVIKIYFNIPDELFSSTSKLLHNNDYNNHVHKVWSFICLFIFNPLFNESKKKIYTSCSQSEYDKIMNHHNESIPPSKYNNPQIYKTLEYKRTFAINPLCSSFQLLRDSSENICHEFWYHWEFHTLSTPIWIEKFKKYNIEINHDKKRVEFLDDDELEDFYSQYGYEPDEQSTETQNKALSLIQDNNWKKWYENIFQDNQLFNFKDDFKFAY